MDQSEKAWIAGLALAHVANPSNRPVKVVEDLAQEGATASSNLRDFANKLDAARASRMMVPAAVVDNIVAELAGYLQPGDLLIDGGHSYYIDDIRRAKELASKGIHYVDVGTSGGVWGSARGYCMMIGGETMAVKDLDPIFKTLAPGDWNNSANTRTRETGRHRRIRLFIGPERRRSFREDGPQRH